MSTGQQPVRCSRGQDIMKSHISPPWGQSWREASEEPADFCGRRCFDPALTLGEGGRWPALPCRWADHGVWSGGRVRPSELRIKIRVVAKNSLPKARGDLAEISFLFWAVSHLCNNHPNLANRKKDVILKCVFFWFLTFFFSSIKKPM